MFPPCPVNDGVGRHQQLPSAYRRRPLDYFCRPIMPMPDMLICLTMASDLGIEDVPALEETFAPLQAMSARAGQPARGAEPVS